MIILAIETSCDETSVAIINSKKMYYNNIVYSQSYLHKKFGGVVPEISSRKHLEIMPYIVESILRKTKIKIGEVEVFAATGGPGIVSSIVIGVLYAKTMSILLERKFISINHLEGHILIPKLIFKISYPYMVVLMSGGHSQIIIVNNVFKYKIVGETIDDSIGETFDKFAKMLNLTYPGGPVIEKYAKHGNIYAFNFGKKNIKNLYNFSFSGLKTSIKNQINRMSILSQKDKSDLCASFQHYIATIIIDRIKNSINNFISKKVKYIVLSGGVASNKYIRRRINLDIIETYKDIYIYYPPIELCTDNALMIAYSAIKRLGKIET